MIPHAALAALAAKSYTQTATVAVDLDVQAMASMVGNEFVVVCPGTHPANPIDWIRDFDAWPRYFGALGICHHGFAAGGVDLWARVRTILPPAKRVVYAGHSLGGALALVLAASHATERAEPCRVVTFGAPRTGCLKFGRLVRSALEVAQYRFGNDPVPGVPPPWLYWHPTKLIGIGSPEPDPIAAHSIAGYAAELSALGL